MKYLVVMREYYESDNNTPSDKIWVKVANFESEQEKSQAEKKYLKEVSDEAVDCEIDFRPLEDLSEWEKVMEIW